MTHLKDIAEVNFNNKYFLPGELRLNNIVLFANESNPKRKDWVEWLPKLVTWEDIKLISEDPEYFTSCHSWEYASDEWMQFLGFKKINTLKWAKWINEEDGVTFFWEHRSSSEYKCDHAGIAKLGKKTAIFTEVYTVHRLQNLYYDISGNQMSIDSIDEIIKKYYRKDGKIVHVHNPRKRA